jgi:hypothetical protein
MRKCLVALVALFTAASAFGQAVSQKKDVAVFRLSAYDVSVPPGTLGQVDAQIQDVFVNLGRFNVIGMDYRLSESDVSDFIDKIKEIKTSQATLPEAVHLGKQAFTQADLDRIAGSFIVVIPVLTSYTLDYDQSSGFTAQLDASFTLVSVDSSQAIAHFDIHTIGTADTAGDAAFDAASGIAPQLQFQVRSIPDFQLKTVIVDVEGGTVLIQFGRNMGVKPGDEFSIVDARVLPSGLTVTDDVGLVMVRDVQDEVSYATVLFSSRPPRVGDQLKEIPRIGFEATVYAHALGVYDATTNVLTISDATFGTFETLTRGFYNFRPLIGFEVPLSGTIYAGTTSYGYTGGLPVNLYLGGQLNWRLWRFDLTPVAAIGIGGLLPIAEGDSFYVALAGGFGSLNLGYLVSPQVKIQIDVGFAEWLPLSSYIYGYSGVFGGLGVAIDF